MSIDISRIQALCFDVDGTLNDTDDLYVQRLVGWLRPFRWVFKESDPIPFARWAVMTTETPANFFFGMPDRLGFDDKITALSNYFYGQRISKKAHPFSIIQGVQEMLDQLVHRYPMSVVSARDQRTSEIFLDQFSLHHYFRYIVTAQTCRHTKPYPDPILWAAEKMGVAPSACLMIGDTTVDMIAGKAAGAQTIGVLCGFGSESELLRCGADLVIPSTAELAGILLRPEEVLSGNSTG